MVLRAFGAWRPASSRLRIVRQPEAGQRHAGKTDAEFLQRGAARHRLGHVLCELIESVIHVFSFLFSGALHLLIGYYRKIGEILQTICIIERNLARRNIPGSSHWAEIVAISASIKV
jgi:hypothetical protein